MLRAIGGVVLGYLATIIVVVACFTSLHFGLGTERVFRPGSFEPSSMFLTAAVGIWLVAAILGGFACAVVARSVRPVPALASLFILFGLASALVNLRSPDPGPRTGVVSPFEAPLRARQPDWYSFSLPFIGAGGVLIGGRLKKAA